LTRVLENCTDLPARYRGGKWGMIMGRSKLPRLNWAGRALRTGGFHAYNLTWSE